MRENITFSSNGLRCKGWLSTPKTMANNRRTPTIVMAHGFSAVKEMGLEGYAELFASEGFTTMVFDYRHFGESEGQPRGQLFPQARAPQVDPDRIGVWGTSQSGE